MLNAAAISASALVVSLRPTMPGIIACRAGTRIAHSVPCNAEEISRCTQVTIPRWAITATNSATAENIACAICTSRRRSKRSATTPPTSASDSIGTA